MSSNENARPPERLEVLVVGAGPTGLVLGLWLARLGVRVQIIDTTAEPGTTSRALGVQARTLEFYRQLGLADAVVERGRTVTAVNLWVAGRKAARAVFGAVGQGISPFPYALIYPQDEHERLLIERLAAMGIEVERNTELQGFEDANGRVLAQVKRADGMVETREAAYLAGCDGVHSTVRTALQIGFPGAVYDHLFYVADVEVGGPAMDGAIHVGLDRTDFLALFPLREEGHARFVGTVREGHPNEPDHLSWNDVSQRVVDWMDLEVARVHWFSTYHVHHRVADRFRRGRVFLLGDAAHVHSPVGAQGMNTGIGDAVNLAWKIAAVLRGRASARLLESYEPERAAFARRLVATTDQAFTAVTSPGVIARGLRLHIVPRILPLLFAVPAWRRFMFRTVSQTVVNYHRSRLSAGRVGALRGGDRLPWVPADTGDGDNFAPLTSLDWQVHVYGKAAATLQAVCEARGLPLHVFAWRPAMHRSGLRRNAAYLVRPDGYLALADAAGSAAALTAYLDRRELLPAL